MVLAIMGLAHVRRDLLGAIVVYKLVSTTARIMGSVIYPKLCQGVNAMRDGWERIAQSFVARMIALGPITGDAWMASAYAMRVGWEIIARLFVACTTAWLKANVRMVNVSVSNFTQELHA